MLGIEPSPVPLPDKEWRAHFDALLVTGQMNPDIVPHLDAKQQFAVNEVKKWYARQRYRERRIGDDPDEE